MNGTTFLIYFEQLALLNPKEKINKRQQTCLSLTSILSLFIAFSIATRASTKLQAEKKK